MADDPEFDQQAFTPLKVKCTDSDCETGHHAFSPNRKKKNWAKSYEGECRECGVKLIDWDRVKQRDIRDVEGVFGELQHELIRHVFFHAPFDEKARAEAAKLGRQGLRAKVRPYLEKKIGPAKIWRDGTQTPKEGSAIHFGQHATATCCRKCIEYWHGIPRGHDLTSAELDYCTGLVLAYLEQRMAVLMAQPPGVSKETDLFTPSPKISGETDRLEPTV
jgi:hypothetical protein